MPDFLYRVTHIQQLARHVSSILLQPAQLSSLIYEAGQYVTVIHQDESVSPLSIACAPTNSLLEFHLFHPPLNFKANDLLRSAQQEKIWRIRGPYGACTVSRLARDRPIVFLARGTGFAPIKAVMEALMQSSHPFSEKIFFYWSVPTQEDLYMTDLLEKWLKDFANFAFTPVFTKEFADKEQTSATPLQEIVLRDLPDLSRFQVYASGPKALIYSAFYAFQQHGLHQEWFYSDVLG